ncbi:MAG: quinone-dependent dihydroorotate dehydrogenase [Chlamydiota bacterium]|nr:quinone-dependent dihydroorotate dehydrogenase [Chlamydiota bacterium]
MYKNIVRPLIVRLFKDPETTHNIVMLLLQYLGWQERIFNLVESFSSVDDPRLRQKVFGISFRNPIGLAAGFDKNAVALRGLESLGFGFLEIGTITRYQQAGNPRPRILRMPEHQAIINWMGFNNHGADIVADRLRTTGRISIPIGISMGKSKITPLESAAEDYLCSFRSLYRYGQYFVINVSSPNTPDLRKLQEKGHLNILLPAIQKENGLLAKKFGIPRKPILVKAAPDLTFEAIDELLDVCFQYHIDGIIFGNTTISREGLTKPTETRGGMSGDPLWPKAIAIVRYVYKQTKGKLPIVGVGGITNVERAYEALHYANLIEIYTGLIYEGPSICHDMNKGMLRLMDRDRIKHISELRR